MTRPRDAAHGDHGIPAQLVALAVVMVVLFAYAAHRTGRDAADLLRVRALAETVGHPTDRLILDLQTERRLTAATLGGSGRSGAALPEARAATDRSAAALRTATEDGDPRLLTAGAVRDRADDLVRQVGRRDELRGADAVAGYDRLIDTAFRVYGPEWGAGESELAAESRAVVALSRARELLAWEDTLLTAALAGGPITADDRLRLAKLVATGRYARAEAAAGLPPVDRDGYRRLVEGPRFAALLAVEDRLLHPGYVGPAITVADWRTAADPALTGLHDLVRSAAIGSVERAAPDAALVLVRTGAVLGLGLVTVLALLLTAARTVRRLTAGPARPAASAAARPAEPGSPADGAAVPEPPVGGAAEWANRELFLGLTQRNQALLRDQLTLLDAMERRERTAEQTAELFRLDHLATRIRRNVEKLVTLAGARPARRWRRPVPLLDVARGAVAEVADYHRVLVAPHWPCRSPDPPSRTSSTCSPS